jgi:CDP-diacylglycerol--glycerol-3-phosphate 3-phosphatidyltransferase
MIPYSYIVILAKIAMTAAIIITIISGLDYFIKNKGAINTDK